MITKPEIESSFCSPFIEKQLSEIRDRKGKNVFLESVMNHSDAETIYEINGHKTVLFPGNKGPKTNTWKQTKQMAADLNKLGFDVAFIPEIDDKTCADSLIRVGKSYKISDFKYCVTSNANTLAKELEHGFKQANTIVLKIEHIDSGAFKKAIDYLLRNEIPYGNILAMNKYGKVRIITHKDIKRETYIRKTKGFL